MSLKSNVIGGCGKTEEECRAYYDKQKHCPRFSILDTEALDPYEPSNCVHYNNWRDQLAEDDIKVR